MNGTRRLTLLLGIALALAACGQPQRAGGSTLRSRFVAGPGAAAAQYETAVPAGSAGADDDARTIERTLARVAEARGMKLVGDPRLMHLASWVAAQLTPSGDLPPHAVLDQATRHLGLIEPTPHMIMLGGNSQTSVMADLGQKLEAALGQQTYSHWGGVTLQRDGLYLYLVVLSFRFLELQAVPRTLPAGATIALKGTLTHRFASPVLVVTHPDGHVVRGTPGRGASFEFRVPTSEPGVYRVEVLGDGASGIEPVANFPVHVGQQPRAEIEFPASEAEAPVRDMDEAAQRLLELANAERARAGLAALQFDAELARVAGSHVSDMLEHHFVGHTSPTTGSPSQRVERAGIRTSLVLENIGRGASLSEVHNGLMESPGHRGSLLHPLATHVGISVSPASEGARPDYLATQLFIRVTPKLSGDAAELLLDKVNALRGPARRPALQTEPELRALATRAAARCFEPGASDSTVVDAVRDELQRISHRLAVSGVLIVLGSSLEELAQVDALLDPQQKRAGIGLTQGQRPNTMPNTICGVFVLAK